jgi:hypothetical protein
MATSRFDVIDGRGRPAVLHLDLDPAGGQSLAIEASNPQDSATWRLVRLVRVANGSRLGAWTKRDGTPAWLVLEVADEEARVAVLTEADEVVDVLELTPQVAAALRAAIAGSAVPVAGALRDQTDGAARVQAMRRFAEAWDEVRRSLQMPFWSRRGDESTYHGANHVELRREPRGWELRISIPDA